MGRAAWGPVSALILPLQATEMCSLRWEGLPSGASGREFACWCERCRFDLGWEDLLEEEVATHSNILAWKSPWTEEPGGLQSMGSQRVRNNWSGWTNGTWTWLLGRHFSFVHLSSECLLCTRHWVVIEDLIVNTAGEVSAHGVYHLAG